MENSQEDNSAALLFQKLEKAREEAENAIRFVTARTHENPCPCLNEARYAGNHMIRYMDLREDSSTQKDEELRRAICHFQRIRKDALQYTIWRYAQLYVRQNGESRTWFSWRRKARNVWDSVVSQGAAAFNSLPDIAIGKDEEIKGCVTEDELEQKLSSKLAPLELLFSKSSYIKTLNKKKDKKLEANDKIATVHTKKDNALLLEEVKQTYKEVEEMMALISILKPTERQLEAVCMQMGYAGLSFSAYVIELIQKGNSKRDLLLNALGRIRQAGIELASFYIGCEFSDILGIVKKFGIWTEILSSKKASNGWEYNQEDFKETERFYLLIEPTYHHSFVKKCFSISSSKGIVEFRDAVRAVIFVKGFNALWGEHHASYKQMLKEKKRKPWLNIVKWLVGLPAALLAIYELYKLLQSLLA